MRIIEIATLENGSHRNQSGNFKNIPEGWAIVPISVECENFPFGEVEVKDIGGVMMVTKWVAGEMPEVEPEIKPEAKPTANDILNALLGVTE